MRITDLLSPLGLLVIVGAKIWEWNAKTWTLPGKYDYYLIAGLALIVLHVALRWDDIVRVMGERQMKYGGNALVLGVAVLGILGLANYFAFRHSKRWDFTKSQRYSLSDQTKKVVRGLGEEVTLWYFQRSVEVGAGRERLTQMQQLSPKLKVEFVDPVAQPRWRASSRSPACPTLVVVRGGKREKIGNDSEQDVVNAVIKVTRESQKTLCFVTGEGERGLDDSSAARGSALKDALAKSQYETKELFLVREPKVARGMLGGGGAGAGEGPGAAGGRRAARLRAGRRAHALPAGAGVQGAHAQPGGPAARVEPGARLRPGARHLAAQPGLRHRSGEPAGRELPLPRDHQGLPAGHRLPHRAQREGERRRLAHRHRAEPGRDLARLLGRGGLPLPEPAALRRREGPARPHLAGRGGHHQRRRCAFAFPRPVARPLPPLPRKRPRRRGG